MPRRRFALTDRRLRRIALFQYGWPLQSHVVNLACSLAQAGVEVDMFIKNCPTNLVDLPALSATPGVTVHDLSERSPPPPIERIKRRLRYSPVDEPAVRAALALARGRAPEICIGVEKWGLIWAGRVCERTGQPLVYYSLELYDDEHPAARQLPHYSRLRAFEKQYHARARATIVQDQARGAWLLRSNGLSAGKLIILPVSVAGSAVTRKGHYLRERFRLPPGRPILLYLGLFDEARGCLRIAQLARSHADQFAIVFHGYGETGLVRRLQEAGALVSTDLVSAGQLPELVSSADIGLAFYRSDCANDRLTAFSSEKVALYCQAGVPFIAQDTESYRQLFAEYRCGERVADPAGIAAAAQRILGDYECFRRHAYRAFEACYRWESHARRLTAQLAAQMA
jgi:glycosyltransferase involved in cell wall biosynthesis